MNNTLKVVVFVCLVMVSCGRKPEWNEEIAKMTNKDIKSWLKTAPFEGLWDPHGNASSDEIVFTNVQSVFPFMGKYKNSGDSLDDKEDIYSKDFYVFKDSTFGESFVHATLLYEGQPLYLESSYRESANIIFSGAASAGQYTSSSLEETKLIAENKQYRTGVYWVEQNYDYFLMGFYQKDNLVFQVAFPCPKKEASKGLDKLKEVSSVMNLNIKEWENASVKDLRKSHKTSSFWKRK
ncbi:hypothetical protein ABWH96_05280 [Marivirga tractuosa]|uniref:hypothetical protein n=1 Tax=Marivirga tractuosa TaxID=1006 RepID=UPI0035CFBF23